MALRVLITTFEHWKKHRDWALGLVRACQESELLLDTVFVDYSAEHPKLSRRQLENLWARRDRGLLRTYARIWGKAEECDVLLHFAERNLHPEFVNMLPTFNVLYCVEDPEGSHEFSAGIAPAYDGVLYGNIAAKFQYEEWGCRRIAFIHHVNAPQDLPRREEIPDLLARPRDVPILFVGERHHPFRRKRLDALVSEFPEAQCFGRGWPGGVIPHDRMLDLYRRARIGWNIHNSTGPINRRLYALPAFGVLQICDNKTGLGKLFRLGEEVLGFDTIEEAIDLTRYYLDHPDEAREIAAAGCQRYWKDYHIDAFWRRLRHILTEWLQEAGGQSSARGPDSLTAFPRTLGGVRVMADRLVYFQKTVRTKAMRVVAGTAGILGNHLLRYEQKVKGAPRPDVPVVWGVDESVCFRDYREASVAQRRREVPRCATEAIEKLQFGGPDVSQLPLHHLESLLWAAASLLSPGRRILYIGPGATIGAAYAAVDPQRDVKVLCPTDQAAGASFMEKKRAEDVGTMLLRELPSDGDWDVLVVISFPRNPRQWHILFDFAATRASRVLFVFPQPVTVGSGGTREGVVEVADAESAALLVLSRFPRVKVWWLRDRVVPWLEHAVWEKDSSESWHPLVVEATKELND